MSSARILVVDDEKSIRLTLTEFLRRAGYEAEGAEDAPAALRLLESMKPDVVVTDVILPGMNGIELMREIHAAAPEVKLIVMTGEPTAETAADALRADAVDYLMKPVSRHALFSAVASAVKIKSLEDQRNRLELANRQYAERLEALVDERAEALQLANQRLHSIMEQALGTMVAVMERRDPDASGHEERTAELARRMARKMQLSMGSTRCLFLAGIVHDIGKAHIPPEILAKPGPLTEREFEIVKQHPATAHRLLRRIDFEWPVAEVVHQHHERLDGSGYPQGLKNDEILIESAIMGVADVVVAMTSRRAYRPAHSLEAALEEIQTKRGILYHPQAADACRALFESGEFSLT